MRWFPIGSAFVLVGVVGMVAGAMLVGTGEQALAVSTQPREDQIALTPWVISLGSPNNDWGPKPNSGTVDRVLLNAADYPTAATFTFEAVLEETAWDMETCARLFDLTASLPVPGSEVCLTSAGTDAQRLRSQAFTLPSTNHEYTLHGRIDCSAAQPPGACGSAHAGIVASRLIVEWNEQLVMNPNPGAVGGMVELLSGSNEGGMGRLPSAAAAFLLLGVGGMYAVRMRRDVHAFRRAAAAQMKRLGMNDSDILEVMGWRSVEMLRRYTAAVAEELAHAAHLRHSPGDSLTSMTTT